MSDLKLIWARTEEGIKPIVEGSTANVLWAPQPGSQEAFLSCPIFEVLYEGTRGPGKTDALLMDFVQHVGQGFGSEWRGIIFRKHFPDLEDIINKSLKWFPRLFPDAVYNRAKHYWTFGTGETLIFSQMEVPSDYSKYHGHAYPFIGFEELTLWPDDKCYKVMMSCCRSTKHGMPRKYRATTNPYGVGHSWVKKRFRLPVFPGHIIGKVITDSRLETGELEPPRVAIRGYLEENIIMMAADPDYKVKIASAARNKSERDAWLDGSWDIVSGGMFDDVWKPRFNVIPNIPLHKIPHGWHIDRSYDHGQSKPFSVGWWAESNGEPFYYKGEWYGRVQGDLFRVAEWYGWNGIENEGLRMSSKDIARGILEREDDWNFSRTPRPGPADSAIYAEYDPGKSYAGEMEKVGVFWERADKSPGSRKQGWQKMRELMQGSVPVRNYREDPGLFICQRCDQFIRTIPALARDDRDLDDINTETEDHIADEARYRSRYEPQKVSQRDF